MTARKSILTTSLERATKLDHQMRPWIEDEELGRFEAHCHWCNCLVIIDVCGKRPKAYGWALKRRCSVSKTRGEKR